MEAFQQRVVDEKKELDEKISKLITFIDGDVYKGLVETQKVLLYKQLQYMVGYSLILKERISYFK